MITITTKIDKSIINKINLITNKIREKFNIKNDIIFPIFKFLKEHNIICKRIKCNEKPNSTLYKIRRIDKKIYIFLYRKFDVTIKRILICQLFGAYIIYNNPRKNGFKFIPNRNKKKDLFSSIFAVLLLLPHVKMRNLLERYHFSKIYDYTLKKWANQFDVPLFFLKYRVELFRRYEI